MYLAHIHLLLNHWPIIGSFIALGLFIVALIASSDELKQTTLALYALIALLGIPAYMSGLVTYEALRENAGLSDALVQSHHGAAILAFLFMELTGGIALVGLWQFSRTSRSQATSVARWNLSAVLFLSIVTVGLMTLAGNTGGAIRHVEISSGEETPSAIGTAAYQLLPAIQYWVIDYSQWVWPILEILHFVGLILTVATVATLNLRLLGFLKQLPVAPLHRLLPWGIAGFVVNTTTGLLFFVGMPYFYAFNLSIHLKMLAILLAGANLLLFYCTGVFRAWQRLAPGQDPPPLARFVAASSMFLWVAVIVLGRYLPYTEDSLR